MPVRPSGLPSDRSATDTGSTPEATNATERHRLSGFLASIDICQRIALHRHLLRNNSVQFVVLHLLRAPAVSLVNRLLHRLRDCVGIHYHQTIHISRGPAGSLGQRPSGA